MSTRTTPADRHDNPARFIPALMLSVIMWALIIGGISLALSGCRTDTPAKEPAPVIMTTAPDKDHGTLDDTDETPRKAHAHAGPVQR